VGTIKKILFVVNPIAGGNDKGAFIAYLPEFARENNFSYQIFKTSGTDDLPKLKQEIENFSPNLTVAVGGDGTCNLTAKAIANTDYIMGIIPFGSANGLATELTIPKVYEEALRVLLSGKPKSIDTVLVNGHLCLHISDIGINARTIKRFEEEKIRGIFGYAKQFFKELWGARPAKFVFILDNGKTFKKKAHLVAIANAAKYGTGAVINPNGKMDDGKFELVIVKPYPFWALFSLAMAIFLGYLDKIKYAKIESFEKIKIVKKKTQPLHIDGEIVEETTVVEAVINPASVKVVVPVF
jgi:diacylglycerol kinase (ATP)